MIPWAVTCDLPWRAECAEATLLSGLVTFSPVELLTVNPFHLKKGNVLPASNDNFIELAAGKGAILSAPSQSKPAVAQQQRDVGHTAYPSGRSFQYLSGLERACEGFSPFIRQWRGRKYHPVASLRQHRTFVGHSVSGANDQQLGSCSALHQYPTIGDRLRSIPLL